MISSGDLIRGTRIQQDALAARFETSITPVREALRQLEAEGLLVSEPHRGVRVASADLQEVKATYILRRLVEPYAAKRASLRVSRQDVSAMKKALEEMEKAQRAGESVLVREANMDFHFLLYEKCGIPTLTKSIRNLWLAFPWDIFQIISTRASDSINEHVEILAAVEAGDLEGVGKAVEEHISRSYLALAAHLSEDVHRDPFEIEVD